MLHFHLGSPVEPQTLQMAKSLACHLFVLQEDVVLNVGIFKLRRVMEM